MKLKIALIFTVCMCAWAYFQSTKPESQKALRSTSLANVKAVIFDFDGTICDSYEAAIRTINHFSSDFGYRKVKEEELADLRELTTQELLKSVGISMFKLPFVVRKLRTKMADEIPHLSPFEGMVGAISNLKNKGLKVGVLTSNSEENIKYFANKFDVKLDFVHSGSSLFGKDKVIRKVLKELKIAPQDAVYVGDETRDIEACKAAGIPIIAVSWGYNTKKALKAQNPEYLIDSPNEMVPLFE